MISIINLEKSPPYEKFQKLYEDAIKLNSPQSKLYVYLHILKT